MPRSSPGCGLARGERGRLPGRTHVSLSFHGWEQSSHTGGALAELANPKSDRAKKDGGCYLTRRTRLQARRTLWLRELRKDRPAMASPTPFSTV